MNPVANPRAMRAGTQVDVRSCVANAVGGVGSRNWYRSPISAQIECAAVGSSTFPNVIVARASPDF